MDGDKLEKERSKYAAKQARKVAQTNLKTYRSLAHSPQGRKRLELLKRYREVMGISVKEMLQ